MSIEILPPEGETEHLGQLMIFKKRRTSPVRTPHSNARGHIHEPQAGVDVAMVPAE